MKKLMIIGRVGNDCEVKNPNNGERSVINFSLAHTERYLKDGVKQEVTSWTDCQYWLKNEAAQKMAQYIKKGTQVYVEGKPSARAYIKDGSNPVAVEVITINNLELLGSSQKAEGGTGAENSQNGQGAQTQSAPPTNNNSSSADDDDLPF